MVEKRARHRLVRLAVGRRRVRHDVLRRRRHRGHPDGLHRVLLLRARPDRSPGVPCLVLTPIAAHMVFDRSFVLGAWQEVVLEVVGDEPGVVSADGREGLELPVGSRMRILAAPRPARLVARTTRRGS